MKPILKDRPRSIEIAGDTLILDEDFCKQVLAGGSTRTALRLEAEGLPFVMVVGRKFRPLNAGRDWLAKRISRRNQPAKPRRTSAA
jgi:hypothetical protein